MTRFDKTTIEGNEARLNHGDSERVRLKEEGMNIDTDTDRIEELARWLRAIPRPSQSYEWLEEHATNLCSLSAELTELRQAKESLELRIANLRDEHVRCQNTQASPETGEQPTFCRCVVERDKYGKHSGPHRCSLGHEWTDQI